MSDRELERFDVRALALITALMAMLLLAAVITVYGAFVMKRALTLAAIAAAGLALCACASIPGISVDTKAAPAVQEKQAESNAVLQKALSDRLVYCTITGTLDVQLQATTASGIKNTVGLNCPAKPWETATPQAPVAVVPLNQLGLGQTAPPN